jgi:hypothetical protein
MSSKQPGQLDWRVSGRDGKATGAKRGQLTFGMCSESGYVFELVGPRWQSSGMVRYGAQSINLLFQNVRNRQQAR